MSDAKTEIKSDNNVEDASKVSDVPAVTSGTVFVKPSFHARGSGVCAAEASSPFPASAGDPRGTLSFTRSRGLRTATWTYAAAATSTTSQRARAMWWCRASSSDGAARRHRPPARPSGDPLVAAPCVRTYARTHIPACPASSYRQRWLFLSSARERISRRIANRSLRLLLLSIILPSHLLALGGPV